MPLKEPETAKAAEPGEPSVLPRPCPCCGGRMIIIETFARGCVPALPKFAPSGIAFIWAMNSVTDCAFSVGLTTRTLGTEAM
jgi:hypothetical protein